MAFLGRLRITQRLWLYTISHTTSSRFIVHCASVWAMAAGVTDHLWDTGELISLLETEEKAERAA
jgi:hypothetical protein